MLVLVKICYVSAIIVLLGVKRSVWLNFEMSKFTPQLNQSSSYLPQFSQTMSSSRLQMLIQNTVKHLGWNV